MRVMLFAAIGSALLCGGAQAKDDGGCERRSAADATVTGVVRGIGMLQEEPNAEPVTSFFLDEPDSICVSRPILVFAIGQLACVNGDIARVMGHYSAPSDFFAQPMIDAVEVRCSRAPKAAE